MSTPSGHHAAKAIAKSMDEHPSHWTLDDHSARHKDGFSVWICGGIHGYEPTKFYFGWRGFWLVRRAVQQLKAVKTIEGVGVKISDVMEGTA